MKVPATTHGTVQADVRRNDHWYAGNRFQVSGSGTGGGGGGKGGGGKGGGGNGNSGGGGNGSKPPLVVGGTVPITKAAGAGTSLSHGQPTPIALTAAPTTPAAAPGAALAFTGTAPALWTLTLGGLILMVAGAYLASRRPTPVRARSLESLLRLKLSTRTRRPGPQWPMWSAGMVPSFPFS